MAVIATQDDPVDAPHLIGLEVAQLEHVEGRPVEIVILDDDGDPARTADLLRGQLEDPRPVAIMVVGAPSVVSEHRTAIAEDGRPVFVLGGDLYSTRSLFRQVFQTAVPVLWQARVLARYLARDRRDAEVVVAYERDRLPERDVVLAGLREEGLAVRDVPFDPSDPVLPGIGDADAIVHVGSPRGAGPVGDILAAMEDPPRLAVLNESLRADLDLPMGSVAPGAYAWAGWAQSIPRVEEMRHLLSGMGRSEYVGEELVRYDLVHLVTDAVGAEQEGHDAINALMDALERTGGRTGEPLVDALERNRPEGTTYAALPVILGPDDHTLADESWLGLFAVPDPEAPPDGGVATTPWAPIIRTFTYDGERTIFREEDRTAFFPFWEPGRPSPKYFRSVLGITTGPEDPLQ